MRTITKETTIINDGNIHFPIVPNGSGWKSTEGESLSVIESGQQKVLLSKIIKAIDSAEDIICMQSFLIQDTILIDALVRAVELRGVRVYVLSSVEARLKEKIQYETDFIKADYIQLLETKFKNRFIHRAAENFHGKYILIDIGRKAKGFICTNNFTENGFTKNPELAVELNKAQCDELFKVFVYHFWEHSTDEQTATKEFDKVKPVNKYALPKLEHVLLTSPNPKGNSLNSALALAVSKAKKTILFSTFLLDKNTELIKVIKEKAKQGLNVTLFCRPIERQFDEQLKELLESGVQVFFHPLIHAKSLLVDSKEGFVFTANLVVTGLEKGLEVGINLDEQQISDLLRIYENWKINFPSRALKVAKVKDLKEVDVFLDGKLIRKVLSNDNKVEKQKTEKVGDLISFLSKQVEINEGLTKSIRLKLSAEIEELPSNFKVNVAEKYQVVELDGKKDKKFKCVVLSGKFEPNDIDKIKEWKDLKVYSVKL